MFISIDAAIALTGIYPKEIMTDIYNYLLQGGSSQHDLYGDKGTKLVEKSKRRIKR